MASAHATYPIRFASRWAATTQRVQVAVSAATDVGGRANGGVNQDAFLTFYDPRNSALILGVFDGHGRDAGRDVAQATKRYFEAQFQSFSRDDYARMEREPRPFFQELYEACHLALKDVLREFYEEAGHVVEEQQPEGFLVRLTPATGFVTNVRGGTTATIVVVLDGGRKLFTANVGDSVALLGAQRALFQASDVKIHGADGDALQQQCKTSSSNVVVDEKEDSTRPDAASARSDTSDLLLLTGDHGADCSAEFLRARRARCSAEDSQLPELRFLYDSSEPSARRAAVFGVASDGELYRNATGEYYKNVRDEWATVVATPATALFPDALAFTRSLGDFHMHAYGVSCEPTVMELSLECVLARELGIAVSNQEDDSASASATNTLESAGSSLQLMLVVASDGVWDNWEYDKLLAFLADPRSGDSSDASAKETAAVDALAAALMEESMQRGKQFFGAQADNMTAVLCRLEVQAALPG